MSLTSFGSLYSPNALVAALIRAAIDSGSRTQSARLDVDGERSVRIRAEDRTRLFIENPPLTALAAIKGVLWRTYQSCTDGVSIVIYGLASWVVVHVASTCEEKLRQCR